MEVIILQGIPGSGKSTLAKKLAGEHGRILSADNYFTNPDTGEYKFDVSKLSAAHGWCLKLFANTVSNLADYKRNYPIIVDNTNTTVEEIAPYYALAEAYGFPVKIVRVFCNDPGKAAARNVHGVPLGIVMDMDLRIARFQCPKRWKLEDYVS